MNDDSSRPEVPLILFSGMGADASVFAAQSLAFPHLTVPDWLTPNDRDDLSSYCGRLAESFTLDGPCIIGGASFGGIIALEMTRHIDALGCILIGSVRGAHQLPKRIRHLRPYSRALDITPLTLLQHSAAASAKATSIAGAKYLPSIARQFSRADAHVLRWSARQILLWESTYEDVNVRHIHGDRDFVFPISCVEPDEVVEGGGHVISMTHGLQVNKFIRKHVLQITGA